MSNTNIERFRDEYIGVGLKIGYFRRLRGMTQEQLAERIGLSSGFLSQVEAPNLCVGISLATIFAISEVLDIPAYKFLMVE